MVLFRHFASLTNMHIWFGKPSGLRPSGFKIPFQDCSPSKHASHTLEADSSENLICWDSCDQLGLYQLYLELISEICGDQTLARGILSCPAISLISKHVFCHIRKLRRTGTSEGKILFKIQIISNLMILMNIWWCIIWWALLFSDVIYVQIKDYQTVQSVVGMSMIFLMLNFSFST